MATQRSIPSLDGLRAMSVLLVILCHAGSPFLNSHPAFAPFRQGELGVSIFFVISGFLITHLLLRERASTGRIHLKQFYIRRTLRILPPFYAYLAVAAILTAAGHSNATPGAFLSALTFTWNIHTHPGTWILGHLWSLSMEEQFYLVWPALMIVWSPRANLRLAFVAIGVTPVLRVAAYSLFPAWRSQISLELPFRMDVFLFGCAIAIAFERKLYPKLFRAMEDARAFAAALVYLFAVHPYLARAYRGAFELPVGFTLQAAAISVVLVYAVRNPESPVGIVLNCRAARHLGILSYSLYLWQQLFTGPYTQSFAVSTIAIFGLAEASYWLIERPSLQLRQVVLRGRPLPAKPAVLPVLARCDA